jgi:hypothetical protein
MVLKQGEKEGEGETLGPVAALPESLRTRLGRRLIHGEGSLEEVIQELLDATGKRVELIVNISPRANGVPGTGSSEATRIAEGVDPFRPEQRKAVQGMRRHFERDAQRFRGVFWSRVEQALVANPDGLESLIQWEEAGLEPHLVSAKEGVFTFETKKGIDGRVKHRRSQEGPWTPLAPNELLKLGGGVSVTIGPQHQRIEILEVPRA